MAAHSRPPPLAGTLVLDLSRLLPGPLCAQHLADLGAEVIKIEDTGAGDYARPAVRELANRGKRAISLDLKSAGGRDVFGRLVRKADVVLEGFRPGTMERLGFGYQALRALRPPVVLCSISGFGQDGPRRHEVGHDLNYAALAGVLEQNGAVDAPPVPGGFLLADLLGGTLSAALGIVAALVDARATGQGRHVDVSMTGALLAHSILPLIALNEGRPLPPRGLGTHTGGSAQYRVYETLDGRHLAVAAQEKRFWDAFCTGIGRPDLAAAHGTVGESARTTIAAVAGTLRQRSLAEWLRIFEGVDCCVTPVLRADEALHDPQAEATGLVRRVDGRYRTGLPMRMSELEVDLAAPVPSPGQHSAAILRELGFSDEHAAQLATDGAVRLAGMQQGAIHG